MPKNTLDNQLKTNQIILIIKDARKKLNDLIDSLQLSQHTVSIVNNKQDYMGTIATIKPNLIVVDILMSEVDGWHICQCMRDNYATKDIPLVLINSSKEVAIKVAHLGWQNTSCIAQSSENTKIIYLIENRLSAANHNLAKSSTPQANGSSLSIGQDNQSYRISSTPQSPLLGLNQDIESFASMVYDDLQEPLRSLTTFAELLSGEYCNELDSKGQKYLAKISDSSSRMQTLIENIGAYSRAGKSDRTWIKVDLGDVLEQVKNNLQSEISQTNTQIVAHNLPEVLINPTEIYQILVNLLDNAIKFRRQAIAPYIKVDAVKNEREWLISVSDNGMGIAEEFQSKIFQAFYQLNETDLYSGNGMGLALCQKIVESYGGTMGVESSEEEGSTFYFTIPIEIVPH
ncbi:MAG: ATP-binding protein [Cyanobacteria bacterium P01_G01_bin.19]